MSRYFRSIWVVLALFITAVADAQVVYEFESYHYGTDGKTRRSRYYLNLEDMTLMTKVRRKAPNFKLNTKYAWRYSAVTENVVYDEDELTQIGIVFVNPGQNTAQVEVRDIKWQVEVEPGFMRTTQTVLVDSILVIADYSKETNGARLAAYNALSGKKLWVADVLTEDRDFGTYMNRVVLARFDNKVILEGTESAYNYLQIFDLYTGRRLFSTLQVDE